VGLEKAALAGGMTCCVLERLIEGRRFCRTLEVLGLRSNDTAGRSA